MKCWKIRVAEVEQTRSAWILKDVRVRRLCRIMKSGGLRRAATLCYRKDCGRVYVESSRPARYDSCLIVVKTQAAIHEVNDKFYRGRLLLGEFDAHGVAAGSAGAEVPSPAMEIEPLVTRSKTGTPF